MKYASVHWNDHGSSSFPRGWWFVLWLWCMCCALPNQCSINERIACYCWTISMHILWIMYSKLPCWCADDWTKVRVWEYWLLVRDWSLLGVHILLFKTHMKSTWSIIPLNLAYQTYGQAFSSTENQYPSLFQQINNLKERIRLFAMNGSWKAWVLN